MRLFSSCASPALLNTASLLASSPKHSTNTSLLGASQSSHAQSSSIKLTHSGGASVKAAWSSKPSRDVAIIVASKCVSSPSSISPSAPSSPPSRYETRIGMSRSQSQATPRSSRESQKPRSLDASAGSVSTSAKMPRSSDELVTSARWPTEPPPSNWKTRRHTQFNSSIFFAQSLRAA